ncbi:hypothetical protein DITRI_Ditri15bG0098600 [Diplodiscus trichospermus]
MAEDGVYCCGHRPDPGKHIMEGTFEIDHSPWLCLPSASQSLAILIYSQKGDASTMNGLKSKNADMMQRKEIDHERETQAANENNKIQIQVPGGARIRASSYIFHWKLVKLRRKELEKLRGGSNDERKPWDRIYQYDYYNDLGEPDNGQEYARPVLGGSTEYPYPRRLRTGRPPCHHDHSTESRPASIFQTYVPPDERISPDKLEELRVNFVDALVRFLSPKQNQPPGSNQELPDFIKKIVHFFVPSAAFSTGDFKFILSIINFFRRKPKSSSDQETHRLDPAEDMYDIFAEKEVKEMEEWVKQELKKFVPNEIFNQVANNATKRNQLDSQLPSIIAEQRDAWKRDVEFGRQLLAGTNPVRIRHLKEISTLRKEIWSPERLQSVERWISTFNDYFILEHHEYLMPYLNMINGKGVSAYATRTLLRVYSDGGIDPYDIELSLPDSESSMVVRWNEGFRWELA